MLHLVLESASLLKYRSGAYVNMIFNHNVPIAANVRSECHEVSDYAIMCDIRVDIAVKVSANLRICGNTGEWTYNAAFANFIDPHLKGVRS